MTKRTALVTAVGTVVLIGGSPAIATAATSEQAVVNASTTDGQSEQAADRPRASGATAKAAPPALPIWTPRVNRGVPAAREGGASRGTSSDLVVRTLVPRLDESALALNAAPILYWSISIPTGHAVNFTLVDPDAIDPLLDVALPGPFSAGVQRVDLADHGVELALGKRYEWFVAVVPDSDRRSADTLARGAITRIDDAPLSGAAGAAPSLAATATLAKAGIWYEALASTNALVESEPENAAALAARAALLEQAGLPAP